MVADVLVVGDLLVDVIVRPERPLARGSDTPSTVRVSGGGSAANTACWLAALGHRVRLVAAVGDDVFGRQALADLAAASVTFAGAIDPVRTTGTCVVLVDTDGERTMMPDRGANEGLSAGTVEAALRESPERVHLSGYTLLHAGSRSAGLAALAGAKACGVPVSVDPSSTAPLLDVGPAQFLEWIKGCELLLANEEEIAVLGGVDEALRWVGAVVVKQGAAGAMWTDGRTTDKEPARPVHVVDTVGAGDAFAAGFLDGGLARGCEIAARAVSQPGGRPPPPPNFGQISTL